MRLFYFTFIIFCLLAPDCLSVDFSKAVVKSTTNRDEKNIGDYWIAEDLGLGLKNTGLDVKMEYRNEYQTSYPTNDLFSIFMRGYTDFKSPFPTSCNILYAYYPMAYSLNSTQQKYSHNLPNVNVDDDWQNFDILTVASSSYAQELKNNNIPAIFVPQFTNTDKFFPDPQNNLKTDILFVGSNWHDRTSLRFALENGYNVSVYGYNWQGIVPKDMYKAPYIANDELNKYYSSAKIVLNDHRPDMKSFGFVNNRIYDATASGALVVSDYMPEIEKFYGDTVPMYKTKEELKSILDYYLSHEKERLKTAQQAREITLTHFTNKVVAQKIKNLAQTYCPASQN